MAATICPRPTLTFDLLTLKSVWESRVTWGTPVQSFVFVGLLVFELEPMYATSDRQTDDGCRSPLNAPAPLRGGGIITRQETICETVQELCSDWTTTTLLSEGAINIWKELDKKSIATTSLNSFKRKWQKMYMFRSFSRLFKIQRGWGPGRPQEGPYQWVPSIQLGTVLQKVHGQTPGEAHTSEFLLYN